MRKSQQSFPIDVRTGWVDYSPAIRYHASQRIRSRVAEYASLIRSVAVRMSADEPSQMSHRRCDTEVMTVRASPIAASAIGLDLFNLVDGTVDTVVELLRQRTSAESHRERRQRIA